MLEYIINRIVINTRRAYILLSIGLIIGLLSMVLTVSTHELDEIELSEPYEIVIFIVFMFGMFITFFTIQTMVSIHIINLRHDRLMKEIREQGGII